ncbi:MAG: T9SS type A sorting domain-containing protein, partial [Bacteroidetes bacterium]|nr:T9SS type A sorting domain-containing protein [Bacteroidota bacterium]
YQWVPTLQDSSTATGLSSGTYTITITDSNGCSANDIVVLIDAAAAALTISDSTMVSCNGGSDGSANVNASGGTLPYTYSWDNAETDSTAIGLSAGTYTVTVTDANLCVDSVINIIVGEPAVLTVTLSSKTDETVAGLNDGTMSVSASGGTGAYTYNWVPAPGAGQGTNSVTGLSPGTYAVTVTDSNGCDTTYIDTILAGPVGITEFNNNVKFSIYPNPTNGQFVLEFSDQKKDNYLLEVRNIIGKLIYTQEFNNMSGDFQKQIDFSNHDKGVYFINISSSFGTRTEKIIVY